MGALLSAIGSTMMVFRPHPHVYAFYDGRIEGSRIYSAEPNWLDDTAFVLGFCSYAVVDGDEALIFDTSLSLTHAGIIRQTLEQAGYRKIRVALSHWHDDHVAGNEVFQDCEIIANRLTAEMLEANRNALENGQPPIRPLVMPNRLFDGVLSLKVGAVDVELRQMDIHSRDGTVLYLPGHRLLLAGDTLEDSVTYVAEPDRLAIHLGDLIEMAGWDIDRILPCHGSPEIIAAGGYDTRLIHATITYVEKLLRCRTDQELAALDLGHFLFDLFLSGAIQHFAPYDAVHRRNVEVLAGV